MRKIIFLLLPLFCFCSRQQNADQNVIDLLDPVDKEITRLSEIATEIEYIPLQTNDSCIISRISDIKVCGDFFYVLSSYAVFKSQILCFNNKGEFLYKLDKNGRGPEDYFGIGDFDINFDNSILAVNSDKNVIFYNRTDNGFTYKNRVPLGDNPSSISFVDGENNLMLMYPNGLGNNTISKELINLNGESIRKWPNYFMYVPKDNMVVSFMSENLSYIYDNKPYIKELQNDTLFYLSDGNILEPYIVLNTGDRRVTPEARSNGGYFSEHTDEYIILKKVMESDRYLYYSYSSNPSQSFFYDKKTKVVYKVDSKTKLIDDLNGGVNFDPQYCKNGIFYSWIDAIDLKKNFSVSDTKDLKYPDKYYSLSKFIDTLNEYDNPIIIMAKIK